MRRLKKIASLLLIFTFSDCASQKGFVFKNNPLFGWLESSSYERTINPDPIFQKSPNLIAHEFEFPAGGKLGETFYIAQKFGVENQKFGNRLHLGEDWNFIGGGDSDFGSPVYSVADGVVSCIANYGGGWGKVIRVVYKIQNNQSTQFVEALYAHLYTIEVEPGQMVRKGEWLGGIGDASGKYSSHLHFELREEKNLPLGGGYSFETKGYLAPTKFIINRLGLEKKMTEDQFLYERLAPTTGLKTLNQI
ncbi:peptidase, M23 family [Leptospira ryugenii]|uniref:Peptidase, M23 family n=1 Tax=Leptospira ryugenii TaxID=1917863 RepID=A0A2P2E2M5_9LEPT|nr:M23 family metallopeptidase [Leptospira ryugenii]GBF51120.1 peptidase, M23 family [Leptospira ryugenii]